MDGHDVGVPELTQGVDLVGDLLLVRHRLLLDDLERNLGGGGGRVRAASLALECERGKLLLEIQASCGEQELLGYAELAIYSSCLSGVFTRVRCSARLHSPRTGIATGQQERSVATSSLVRKRPGSASTAHLHSRQLVRGQLDNAVPSASERAPQRVVLCSVDGHGKIACGCVSPSSVLLGRLGQAFVQSRVKGIAQNREL